MPSWRQWSAIAALFAVFPVLAPGAAVHAQPVEEFYKGKQVSLIVGAAAGGAYDLVSRTVAAHMGRHIPGRPTFVVSNMDGASSLIMTNHLYNVARKDGTVMGLGNANIALEPRLKMLSRGGGNAMFDIRRFNWVGSALQQPQVIWVFHTAPVKSIAEARATKVILGSTGAGGDNFTVPWLINKLIGTQFEIVSGYKGQGDIFVAAERGEIHGNTAILPNLTGSRPDWWRDKKVRVLVHVAAERMAAIPDVPAAIELASSSADRDVLRFWSLKYKMAYPMFMPPDVPADRIKAIRAAFDATMRDPVFLADANKNGLDINAFPGEAMAGLIEELQAAPQALVDRVAELTKLPGQAGPKK